MGRLLPFLVQWVILLQTAVAWPAWDRTWARNSGYALERGDRKALFAPKVVIVSMVSDLAHA